MGSRKPRALVVSLSCENTISLTLLLTTYVIASIQGSVRIDLTFLTCDIAMILTAFHRFLCNCLQVSLCVGLSGLDVAGMSFIGLSFHWNMWTDAFYIFCRVIYISM